MKISITYCGRWKYLPQASSLAAEIKKTLGIESELIEGKNGIFDVTADDQVVFSKYDKHRFPEATEIINALQTQSSE